MHSRLEDSSVEHPAAVRPAAPAPVATLTGLHGLQRQIGNRAVVDLVQREGGGTATATAPAKTALTAEMSAAEVAKAVDGSRAGATALRFQWYVSGPDRKNGPGCYSTAYGMGRDGKWEIHCHRDAKGRIISCNVQAASAVGNTNATRNIPINAPERLSALGVPDRHQPTTAQRQWVDL